MRILLAVDGSPDCQMAIQEVIRRPWPESSEVAVLSVASPFPFFPDPIFFGAAWHMETLKVERERAPRDAHRAAEEIRNATSNLTVTELVAEGSAKKCIIEEADKWGADLIVLGARGHGGFDEGCKRFLLGSVAMAVALHAPCSIEVVRKQRDS